MSQCPNKQTMFLRKDDKIKSGLDKEDIRLSFEKDNKVEYPLIVRSLLKGIL